MDVLNALEPTCALGGEDTTTADDLMRAQMFSKSGSRSKFKSRANPGLRSGSHTDAVMTLSWNTIHKQVIASGSADKTVKLWDVTKATEESANASTFRHHRDKVGAVRWHPQEGTLLATGSYDRTVALLDARSNGDDVRSVKVSADCEALSWDPFRPEYLTAATEDGTITCWDVRKFETKSPVWSFVANEYGGVTDLAYNRNVPGMMATCSVNKTVTLWDCFHESRPVVCGNKDMCVGKLYTVSFYPSQDWLLGCGGSGNMLALWDLSNEKMIQTRFAGRKGDVVQTADAPDNEGDLEKMMTPVVEADTDNSAPASTKLKKGKKKKIHRKGR